jgi:hypothetical protein
MSEAIVAMTEPIDQAASDAPPLTNSAVDGSLRTPDSAPRRNANDPREGDSLPSPPKEVAEPNLRVNRQRMLRYGFVWSLMSKRKQRTLVYFLGKGIDDCMPAGYRRRREELRLLLDRKNDVGRRAMAVLNADGDKTYTPEQATKQGLSDYYMTIRETHLPVWLEGNRHMSQFTFTIFDEAPCADQNELPSKKPRVQAFYRFQKYGLCYLQAPILLHFYLMAWHNFELAPEEIARIDLTKFVRNGCSPQSLYNHIYKDTGDASIPIATDILSGDGKDVKSNIDVTRGSAPYHRGERPSQYLVDFMKKCGPGLVSNFAIHEDFKEVNQFQYSGSPQGKALGGHAMVLVGLRVGDDRKVYLLLQNFWITKQFVEVDFEYFHKVGAALSFFGKPNEVSKSVYTRKGTERHAETVSELEHPDRFLF